MGEVRKREAAKRDLIAQWVWYAENVDIETADRFLKAAEETASMLAGQPEAGYRFYSPLKDGIELVRVVHGNRDLESLLMEGFFG